MNNDPKLKTKAEKDRRLKEKQAANTKKIIDERKSKGMKENKASWKERQAHQFFTHKIAGEDQVAKHSQEGIGGLEQMGQGLTYEIQIENASTDDQRWRYTLLTLMTPFHDSRY